MVHEHAAEGPANSRPYPSRELDIRAREAGQALRTARNFARRAGRPPRPRTAGQETYEVLCRPSRPSRRSGLTLVELVVSLGILAALGAGLVALLAGGVRAWQRGEAMVARAGTAVQLLERMASDLRTVYPSAAPALVAENPADGTYRLRMIRRLPGDSLDPLTRQAGDYLLPDARIDGEDDMAEAQAGRLAASGGLAEVSYTLGPDGVIYRSFRSPVDDTDIAPAALGSPLGRGVLRFEAFPVDPRLPSESSAPDPSRTAPSVPDPSAPSSTWRAAVLPDGTCALPPAVRLVLELDARGPGDRDAMPERWSLTVGLPCERDL